MDDDDFPELYKFVSQCDSIGDLEFFAMITELVGDPLIDRRERILKRCKWCGIIFNSTEELAEHEAIHRNIAELNAEPESPTPDIIRDLNNAVQHGSGNQQTTADQPYVITKTGERVFAKTLAKDTTFEVKFKTELEGRKLIDIQNDLRKTFNDVLNQARVDGADLGRVVLHSDHLKDPIIAAPLQPWDKINTNTIMEEVAKVLNSNESVPVDQSFRITIGSIELPKGGSKLHITNFFGPGNSVERKKSLFYIINDNTMCLAIAIGLCFFKLCKKVNAREWYEIVKDDTAALSMLDKIIKHTTIPLHYYKQMLRRGPTKIQKEMALALCQKVGVPTDRFLGLNDIQPFENILHVNILVIGSRAGNTFIRVIDHEQRPNIYLYLVETEYEKHWHGIANIQGFFKSSYFCTTCLKPYQKPEKHTCSTNCNVCLSNACGVIKDEQMSCAKCFRLCRSRACFERHRIPKTKFRQRKGTVNIRPSLSECESKHQCKICARVMKTDERPPEIHECGETICTSCRQYNVGTHLCYQRAIDGAGRSNKTMIFYDFETRADTKIPCSSSGYQASEIRCRDCVDKVRKCSKCLICRNCKDSSCGLNQHTVNFAVMQSVCHECENKPYEEYRKCNYCGKRCAKCRDVDSKTKTFKNPPCPDCGERERIFKGDNALRDFCEHLLSIECKNAIAIAHNAKAFDLIFVLETLLTNHSIKPDKIIYSNSKIMYMHVGKELNLTFLCSLNFLPMKLASIPKAFGFENTCIKGYFPHHFNTIENQNYVGLYPSQEYYGIDYLSADERSQFLTWYATKENETFNFQEQIMKYCRSDVDILHRGCMQFRQLMLEVTNEKIDVFSYCTIASCCAAIFKALFLREEHEIQVLNTNTGDAIWASIKNDTNGRQVYYNNEWTSDSALIESEPISLGETRFIKSNIARVPSEGYVKRDNFSKISICWLEWLMEQSKKEGRPIHIQHALNSDNGEYRIPGTNFRADGYDSKNNEIFEFLGCAYHGCPTCFRNRYESAMPIGHTIDELYKLTKKRQEKIELLGFRYTQIWEHEFQRMLKRDDVKTFVEKLEIEERLQPRDGFYGGRTNATKLYYDIEEGETIEYYDFCSLYPFINKTALYPIGHPRILHHVNDLEGIFGMAKARVLPPHQLYHPVLPFRSNGKLKFPLCKKCAETEANTSCTHTDSERVLTGVWCTPELNLAVSKGYKIEQIYEVYHFDETSQYDPKTKTGGLFAEYVNLFLKLKTQSSGWPSECKTEEQKRQYIKEYEEKEGIVLVYEEIKKNPGLRSLAKLCLNSFWGKFAQRLGLKQSDFIDDTEAAKFFQLLADPRKEVKDFHIITEHMIQLEWNDSPLFLPTDAKTNIFLAAFTTMWARLRLYEVLDIVSDNCLYFDTDSCIWKCPSSGSDIMNKLPIGNYLGELTNEISPEDGYITRFCSGGPKNYCYRTLNGQEVCKIRGFTLNWTNSKLINFDSMKDLLTDQTKKCITTTNPCKISRFSRKRKICNREEAKDYQIVYTKRRILDNFDTLPFGYRDDV